MGNTSGEVPEITGADSGDDVPSVLVNSADLGVALEDISPLGVLVPVKFAINHETSEELAISFLSPNGTRFKAHVNTSHLSSDGHDID